MGDHSVRAALDAAVAFGGWIGALTIRCVVKRVKITGSMLKTVAGWGAVANRVLVTEQTPTQVSVLHRAGQGACLSTVYWPSEDQRDLGNYRQGEPSASQPSVTLV